MTSSARPTGAADHDPAVLAGAQHRILDHYVHAGFAAARLLSPQGSPITISRRRNGVPTLRE